MNKNTKFQDFFKWLYPGIGIKRWVVASIFSVALLIFGSSQLKTAEFWIIKLLDLIIIASGIIILILGIKNIIRSFIQAIIPSSKDAELVDILFQRKQLARGPRIVTVGGGTGLSVLLSGLKEYSSNLTAIVTVADDGGSSGRLRQQFDILPPGDIRNCLVALADAERAMTDLFQHRFKSDSGNLSGHSIGNLLMAALTDMAGGDFEKAIEKGL